MADLNRIAEIRGLPLSISDDGTVVTLGEGHCFLPSGRRIMSPGVNATVSAAQPIGLLHAYAMEGSNNLIGLELSATGPDAPYRGVARAKQGDPTRRYLATGRVESVGKLRAGRHLIVGSRGNVVTLYRAATATTVPVQLLSLPILALTPPTQQVGDLTGLISPAASAVELKVSNMSNLTAYLGVPAMGALSRLNHIMEVAANSTVVFTCPLDSDLKVTMLASATGLLGNVVAIGVGTVQISVMGYVFDR